MLSDQDASQTGAKPVGLKIRLFGLASLSMAAISSSRNSKVEDSQIFDDAVGMVVRDKATTSSCRRS
jgi:hypothetical protein